MFIGAVLEAVNECEAGNSPPVSGGEFPHDKDASASEAGVQKPGHVLAGCLRLAYRQRHEYLEA
jgi:hypothetical protein